MFLKVQNIFLQVYFSFFCLFGTVKLTENFDPDKYGYTCYGIGFDAHSQF